MRQVAALMSALFGVAGCSQILGLNNNITLGDGGTGDTGGSPDDAALVDLPANIVFVTSTMQAANYGGIAGADNLCQAEARAAGLAGTYHAWLSTSTASALSHLGTATGWVRRDGLPVANMPADLAAGAMFYPIRLTASGSDVLESAVHTATTASGTLNPGSTTCNDYTVEDGQFITIGFSSGTSSLFTTFDRVTCATPERLYCFGVSKQNVVAVVPPPVRRRAFLTSGDWPPSGGIASADMLCASEASAKGLPGTYKALLATTTASAASRFNAALAPWSRSDGVPLAPTAAALFSSTYWDSALTVFADGSYASSGALIVAGGATDLTSVGTAALTCNDWASSTGTLGGGINGATRVGALFALQTDVACSSSVKLACLQE
jgi:hypothetical protein